MYGWNNFFDSDFMRKYTEKELSEQSRKLEEYCNRCEDIKNEIQFYRSQNNDVECKRLKTERRSIYFKIKQSRNKIQQLRNELEKYL
jgi:hypothetical protein